MVSHRDDWAVKLPVAVGHLGRRGLGPLHPTIGRGRPLADERPSVSFFRTYPHLRGSFSHELSPPRGQFLTSYPHPCGGEFLRRIPHPGRVT